MFRHLWSDTSHLISASRSYAIGVACMIGSLILLLNMLLVVSAGMTSVSSDLRDKLGLYFYIRDDIADTERVYTSIIKLRDELRNDGMKAEFISKDQAMQFLEKRLPNVLNNLKEYNINNPLPATLYVTVNNEQHYEKLKEHMATYSSIITNTDQLQSTQTLKNQEQRVIKTITAANSMVIGSYILVGMLLIIIVTILVYVITNDVHKHHRILEIKKLLGASYRSMTLPFIMYGVALSIGGWILGIMSCIIMLVVAQPILLELVQIDSWVLLSQHGVGVVSTIGLQALILTVLVYTIGHALVYRQVRRL